MKKYPTLENLLSSVNKLRIIKYFIRNPEGFFEKSEITRRLEIRSDVFNREAKNLVADDFLKFKKKGKFICYSLNDKFYLYPELKNLVDRSIPINDDELILKLQRLGKVQLALVAGVFINKDDSRADMVIVGKINPSKFDKFIKTAESRVGKELNFVVMTIEEFKYRHMMFDRFVHDVLEAPHRKLINKIKL